MTKTSESGLNQASKLEFWRCHIRAWCSGGDKITVYCRRHDLSLSRFKYWRERLAPETKRANKRAAFNTSQSSVSFIAVEPSQGAPLSSGDEDCAMRLTLPNGTVLHVSHTISPALLTNLLTALR